VCPRYSVAIVGLAQQLKCGFVVVARAMKAKDSFGHGAGFGIVQYHGASRITYIHDPYGLSCLLDLFEKLSISFGIAAAISLEHNAAIKLFIGWFVLYLCQEQH
jgi:hypothetical protein